MMQHQQRLLGQVSKQRTTVWPSHRSDLPRCSPTSVFRAGIIPFKKRKRKKKNPTAVKSLAVLSPVTGEMMCSAVWPAELRVGPGPVWTRPRLRDTSHLFQMTGGRQSMIKSFPLPTPPLFQRSLLLLLSTSSQTSDAVSLRWVFPWFPN